MCNLFSCYANIGTDAGELELVPEALEMELALKRLVVLDVHDLPIMRKWYVMYRAGKRLSMVAQKFREFVLEESASILDLPTLH